MYLSLAPLCSKPPNRGPEFVGAIYHWQQPHYPPHDSGFSDQMMTRMTKGWRRFKSPKCSDLCGNHGGTQLPEPNISRISLHLKGFSQGFSQTTDPNRFSQANAFFKVFTFLGGRHFPLSWSLNWPYLPGFQSIVPILYFSLFSSICKGMTKARLRLSSEQLLEKDFDFTLPRKLSGICLEEKLWSSQFSLPCLHVSTVAYLSRQERKSNPVSFLCFGFVSTVHCAHQRKGRQKTVQFPVTKVSVRPSLPRINSEFTLIVCNHICRTICTGDSSGVVCEFSMSSKLCA